MNISSVATSFAKIAELVLNKNNALSTGGGGGGSSISANTSRTTSGQQNTSTAISDIISLSATATAAMSDRTNVQSSPLDLNAAILNATGENETNTFSTTYNADGTATLSVTGPLASIVNDIDTTGKVTIQPGETEAQLNFANVYAAQKSAGISGSFYDSHTASDFTANMSSSEAAAFTVAFNSRTLTIQTPQQVNGLKNADGSAYTGGYTQTNTFYESASSGGQAGGQAGASPGLDFSNVLQENQYAFATSSMIFGAFFVSWGGPASSGTTQASSTS